MRAELSVKDVRELCAHISKQLEEAALKAAKAAINGTSPRCLFFLFDANVPFVANLALLKPVGSAEWDMVNIPACMQDTRVQLIADIAAWAQSTSGPGVFWLNGLAGTGKSTVALTVCRRFAEKGLLGASFFIARQVPERRDAMNIIRTIAYRLARSNASLADLVSQELDDSPELASSRPVHEMVSKLIVTPVRASMERPIAVIVLDALDECDEDSRGQQGGELLPLLIRGLLQLSGRLKLLVTSRAERTISRMFDAASDTTQRSVVQLHDLDQAMVREDIHTYVRRSFSDIALSRPQEGLQNWPSAEEIALLVERSQVFFIFASTAIRFVDNPNYSPRKRLDQLLVQREGTFASPYRLLDQLYTQVLASAVKTEEEDAEWLCQRLRAVVGAVVLVRQPLSADVLARLLNMDTADVELVVGSLSSVLLTSSSRPVRTFHPSFPDFIVDPKRCTEPRFLVVPGTSHGALALGCLTLLNGHLRYNICDLTHAGVANEDISDLYTRFDRAIYSQHCEAEGQGHHSCDLATAILYASQNWALHAALASHPSEPLWKELGRFSREHLFHWLEILSIAGHMSVVDATVPAAIAWCEVCGSIESDHTIGV
jgi:hypothetical protein